jgi:hypothetical protein
MVASKESEIASWFARVFGRLTTFLFDRLG